MAVETLEQGDIEIVFVGSSHIYTGIDPTKFEMQSVNVADSALNYQMAEVLCRKYWDAISKAKTVVVELDAVPIYADTLARRNGDYRELYEWNLTASEFPQNWFNSLKTSLRARFTVIRRKRLWPAALMQQEGVADHVRPGFHPRQDGIDEKDCGAFFADLETEASDAMVRGNMFALEKLVARLLENDVKVILYRPPFHSGYWEHPTTATRETYTVMAANLIEKRFPESGIKTVDYGQLFAQHNESLYFSDWTHLSELGARVASSRLNDEIAKED